jgi:hypothetical protein
VLKNKAHPYPLHLLLFTMPGLPSIYSGSEWGVEGAKVGGDDRPLRPALPTPDAGAARGKHPDLAAVTARLAAVRRDSPALRHGGYRPLHVAAEQFAFERDAEGERVVVVANASAAAVRLEFAIGPRNGEALADRLGGDVFEARNGKLRVDVPPAGGASSRGGSSSPGSASTVRPPARRASLSPRRSVKPNEVQARRPRRLNDVIVAANRSLGRPHCRVRPRSCHCRWSRR